MAVRRIPDAHACRARAAERGDRGGKAANKGKWEVAYFNKQVRTDATVADVADSDFGDGGTNRKGHIVWIGYALTDFMNLSVKHFDTEVINVALAPGRDDINRTQVDLLVKF